MDLCAQAIEAQFEQHSTGLMADFVSYNASAGRYEPVDGQVRHIQSFETPETQSRLAPYVVSMSAQSSSQSGLGSHCEEERVASGVHQQVSHRCWIGVWKRFDGCRTS